MIFFFCFLSTLFIFFHFREHFENKLIIQSLQVIQTHSQCLQDISICYRYKKTTHRFVSAYNLMTGNLMMMHFFVQENVIKLVKCKLHVADVQRLSECCMHIHYHCRTHAWEKPALGNEWNIFLAVQWYTKITLQNISYASSWLQK